MGVKNSDVRKLIELLKQKGSIGSGARNPYEQLKLHLDTGDIDRCRSVVRAAVEQGDVRVKGTIDRPQAFELRGNGVSQPEDRCDRSSALVAINRLQRRSRESDGLVEIECQYAGWDQLALALDLDSSSELERCIEEATSAGQLDFDWDCTQYPPKAVFLFETSSQLRSAA